MMLNKTVIAVTGGIGSGKSTACKYLQSKGFTVIDCDLISREVSSDKAVLQELTDAFGQGFVIKGVLQRRALREYVFGDKTRLAKLDSIFLQRIIDGLKRKIVESTSNTVFVEVTNYAPSIKKFFNLVWLIVAPDSSRLPRVAFRDNVSFDQVQRIINKQYIVQNPDETINNDGYVEQLHAVLDNLIEKYSLKG